MRQDILHDVAVLCQKIGPSAACQPNLQALLFLLILFPLVLFPLLILLLFIAIVLRRIVGGAEWDVSRLLIRHLLDGGCFDVSDVAQRRARARYVNKAQQSLTGHVGTSGGDEVLKFGEQLDGERIKPQ